MKPPLWLRHAGYHTECEPDRPGSQRVPCGEGPIGRSAGATARVQGFYVSIGTINKPHTTPNFADRSDEHFLDLNLSHSR